MSFEDIETCDTRSRLDSLMLRSDDQRRERQWITSNDPGMCGHVELPEAIKARALCRLFLTALPDEALSEALESLAMMGHFYRTRAAPAYDPPPPSQAVTLGKTYVRPWFHVAEE